MTDKWTGIPGHTCDPIWSDLVPSNWPLTSACWLLWVYSKEAADDAGAEL